MGEDHEGFGQKEREVSFAVAAAVTVFLREAVRLDVGEDSK